MVNHEEMSGGGEDFANWHAGEVVNTKPVTEADYGLLESRFEAGVKAGLRYNNATRRVE